MFIFLLIKVTSLIIQSEHDFTITSGQFNPEKVNEAIGFGAAGFGLSLNLSKRTCLVIESSFSGSFDYNYIFVPVDLTLRINL